MPSRKAKTVKAPTAQAKPAAEPAPFISDPDTLSFPFAAYTGLVGIHTSLLAFTALYLPRSSLYFPQSLYNAYYQVPDYVLGLPKSDVAGTSVLAVLTASPVQTLAWTLGGVALLQAWWGGYVRQWALRSREEGSQGERKAQRQELEKDKVAALNQAFVTTAITSVVFFAVIVLFGAPLASHLPHTYLLSLLLSFLAVFPAAYTLGIPLALRWPTFSSWPELDESQSTFVTRIHWVRLFAELSPRSPVERALVYPAAGTALGCWLGAIPLALDWDRSWQAWPLPPTYGALLGYVLGSFVAMAASAVKYFAEMNRLNIRLRAERGVKEERKKK
ncbi:hypothetical protein GLOTRDRAFT_81862 [Gloeophyllum trabeum ATCC 11539]|uniref:PIG-F-domain-containing protein n=1 Tax=Gloeophyllum trabeum (strain ATCC 11539 / FP-39264 / Madison 617) TaxID=670483 RepID=S7PTL1_GLOTA|nr:uncharacterized protein GLOTRDRAFT_81862 [Gloeophyllum trabeum ATCC 11539]EPQ50773.1 hypothetical protein GLOTRDRAFT_81862 [Gloeophyllum trabeum ATCC 11539]